MSGDDHTHRRGSLGLRREGLLALRLQQIGIRGCQPQPGGICGRERRRVGAAPQRALEHEPGRGLFPQVDPGTRLDDAQFDGLIRVRGLGQRGPAGAAV